MKPLWSIKHIAFVTLVAAMVTQCSAQFGGFPGAYSRMGFGARGAGMGNAMTAVTTGDISSYYNPALLPSLDYRFASASFGVLGLDRRLNFLGYSQHLPPEAGISFGLINSGVTNIDGRDFDGVPTGAMQTSENQVILGFGTSFKSHLSIGINVKFLYYHLYTSMTSTTIGVDLGLLYPVTNALAVGFTARDIGSKYKWDSTPLYGSLQGASVNDLFPQLYTLGGAYALPDSLGMVSCDFEISNVSTLIARVGVEVPLIPELTLRAGVDRIDLKQGGNGIRPSFGLTVRPPIEGLATEFHYAYVIEPFAPSGMHMISLAAIF